MTAGPTSAPPGATPATLRAQVAFHLVGERANGALDAIEDLGLRPALFAGYEDLAALRYDYPLILVEGAGGGDPDSSVRTLTGTINGILRRIAPPGAKGERLRRQVLALETEIRALAAGGRAGRLTRLWDIAADALLARAPEDRREGMAESFRAAREALDFDGEILDCGRDAPARFLIHAWAEVQAGKARAYRERIGVLALRLSEILKADDMKSPEARRPEALEASMGDAFAAEFDFDRLSRLLTGALPAARLPERRRRRIEEILRVLESDVFAAATAGGNGEGPAGFVFRSCGRALDAFRRRLPEMAATVRAIAMAELEVENRYVEEIHDPVFERFDETALEADDLARFPSCLVCLPSPPRNARERAELIDALSSELPIKVLVRTDDILDDLLHATGPVPRGVRAVQLASMAVGLNSAYVLQTPASHLYRMRERVRAGLTYRGPALFSVFSGAVGETAAAPPYLIAAAAMQSRAFPAFAFDPAAGRDWAARFSIEGNPQVADDWPISELVYEDAEHQRRAENVAFTLVDFALADRRAARYFARVPRAAWHGAMVPAAEFMARDDAGDGAVPYVVTVDAEDRLQRVVVEEHLIHAALRCREAWHSLQELGGVNNSHARRLLARERELWEQAKEIEIAELRRAAARPATPAPAEAPAEGPAEAPAETRAGTPGPRDEAPAEGGEEEPPGDEPYIETPRCTTCNECIQINDRLFAYNENRQAYIADLSAGSFRDLVEAAENCQVSIIHPGRPRDPDEPGLDDLIARAEPFN